MLASGMDSQHYRRFLNEESSNFDDSGYFSIQVIQRALSTWGLEVIPYGSSDQRAVYAREDPTTQNAYICNFSNHWYTIRKIGDFWFNLNSMFKKPEYVSNTYL